MSCGITGRGLGNTHDSALVYNVSTPSSKQLMKLPKIAYSFKLAE
jgi:hypothetical protein